MSTIVRAIMMRVHPTHLIGQAVYPGDVYGDTHGVVIDAQTLTLMSTGDTAYMLTIACNRGVSEIECDHQFYTVHRVCAVLASGSIDVIAAEDLDKYELDQIMTSSEKPESPYTRATLGDSVAVSSSPDNPGVVHEKLARDSVHGMAYDDIVDATKAVKGANKVLDECRQQVATLWSALDRALLRARIATAVAAVATIAAIGLIAVNWFMG